MLRLFTILSVGAAVLSAFALYAVSYQTQQIADTNHKMERQAIQLDREIAILRAERSYLMRPERIENLARQLGMRPVRGDQFITREQALQRTRRP